MNILLFGASGMVGEGVLRWLIDSPKVARVVAVARKELTVKDAKLEMVIEPDMFNLRQLDKLKDFDACFFCLGVSSVGMDAVEYRRVTYDLTLSVAKTLLPFNPRMVFEYISGERTDARSRQAWARVKAETEDALFALGFRDAYGLRPGFIQPLRGVKSRLRSLRVLYAFSAHIYPFLQRHMARFVTSTDLLGAAMLKLAQVGSAKKRLNTAELNALGRQ